MGRRLIDLTGQAFGKLTVIGRGENSKSGSPRWLCRCECGTERVVWGGCLRSGNTRSCGCAPNRRNARHMLSHLPEYGGWKAMMHRCYSPKDQAYSSYGGRGITVALVFHEVEGFLLHMGPRPTPEHTVERIDNDGNYEPGNVKWGTQSEQDRNKRSNRWVVLNGQRMILRDASNLLGIPYTTLVKRLDMGWPEERWSVPAQTKKAGAAG